MKSLISATPLLLLVWLSAHTSDGCPSPRDPPQITSKPIYSRQGSTGDGIEETGEFKVVCEAAYPIDWSFDGVRASAFKVKQTRKLGSLSLDPICYESELTIERYRSQGVTGNYTCSSINTTPSRSASIYRSFYDNAYFYKLYNCPSQMDPYIARKTKSNEFIIPCVANYEKINATLVQIVKDEEIVLSMANNSAIRYDPKIGFLLKATNYSDPVGEYKCLGTFGDIKYRKDYVEECLVDVKLSEVHDTFRPQQEWISFDPISKSVTLYCESADEIEFETNDLVETSIVSQRVRASRSSFTRRYVGSIMLKSTARMLGEKSKGEVSCRRNDDNKSLITTWKFDSSYACQCFWKNQIGDLGMFICSTGEQHESFQYHEYHFQICNNPAECKMMGLCPSVGNCNLAHYSYFGYMGPFSRSLTLGVVKCGVEELTNNKSSIVKHEEQTTLESFFDTYHFGMEEMLTLTSKRSVLYVGDVDKFTCTIYAYSLVGQLRWAFEMKNGTMQYIQGNDFTEPGLRAGDPLFREYENEILITDRNIEKVYCFASEWATGKFFNASMPVQVQEAKKLVSDPAKTGCANISSTPSIILKRTNLKDEYSYPPKDNSVETFQDVTGTAIVLADNEPEIKLICLAHYLTEWTFQGEKTYHSSSKTVSPSSSDSSKLCFQDPYSINIYAWQIGNYTCRNVHDHAVQASVHLYVKGSGTSDYNLKNHGELRTVDVNKTLEWTVLPCEVTHPAVPPVKLHKQDTQGNVHLLEESDSLIYDPTFGYKIKTAKLLENNNNLTDVYICSSVGDGEKDDVKSHVLISFQYAYDWSKKAGDQDEITEGAVIVPWVLVALLALLSVILLLLMFVKSRSIHGSLIHFKVNKDGQGGGESQMNGGGGGSGRRLSEERDEGITNVAFEKFY